jgi:hypothetical protein
MKATVQARSAEGSYFARTENDILLVFSLPGSETLTLGDVVEVDLPNLLASQQVVRIEDGRPLRIRLKDNDIHDLKLPVKHGVPRTPSLSRMRGT